MKRLFIVFSILILIMTLSVCLFACGEDDVDETLQGVIESELYKEFYDYVEDCKSSNTTPIKFDEWLLIRNNDSSGIDNPQNESGVSDSKQNEGNNQDWFNPFIASNDLKFMVNTTGTEYILLGRGNCKDNIVRVPSTINGLPVTSIDNTAFMGDEEIEGLYILNNIDTIGSSAFENCPRLKTFASKSSIKKVGNSAFVNCSELDDIRIKSSTVETIGEYAFYDTAFYKSDSNWADRELYLNNYLIAVLDTKIGATTLRNDTYCMADDAFRGCCSLNKIVINEGIVKIPWNCFKHCSALELLELPYLGASLETPKPLGYLFTQSEGNPYKGTFVNKSNGLYSAYYPSSLNTIKINAGIIAQNAFRGCDFIEGIILGNNVSSISSQAFSYCTSLKTIDISSGLTEIGSNAFSNCSALESVIIPTSVQQIGYSVFDGCSALSSLTIPFVGRDSSYISSSPYYSFGYFFGSTTYENFYSVNQQAGSTSWTYYIPSSMVSVTITSGTEIPEGAFRNCSKITTIKIASNCSIINDYAFSGCSLLKVFEFPATVSSIGNGAFYNCTALSDVTYGGTRSDYNNITKGSYYKEGIPYCSVKCSDGSTSL